MMILALSVGLAQAADARFPLVLDEGTAITDLSTTGERARWVGAIESGSGQLRVLDTATWSVTALAPCSGSKATAVAGGDTVPDRLFVGCADGSLSFVDLSDQSPGLTGVGLTGSGQRVLGLVLVEGVLVGVAGDPDGGLFDILTAGQPGSLSDGDSLTVGSSFSAPGFQDLDRSGAWAVASLEQSFVGRIAPVTGAYVPNDSAVGVVSVADVLENDNIIADTTALIADSDGGVVSFNLALQDAARVLGSSSGLQRPTALALLSDELAVADGDRDELVFFTYNTTTGAPGGTELGAVAFPTDAVSGSTVREIRSITDGYGVVGTDEGQLWVYSTRPWVEAADPASDTVSLGQDVEIAFNADVAGSWQISLNPTDFDAGGGTLASGTLTAGQAVSATVTVSDAWVEGVNQLRILVTDDDGLPGHDAILLSLDSPPSGVTLRSSQVDFGDGKLVLSFNGINAEDLDYYEIYVTTTPFESADWEGCETSPCGGPAYDGSAAFTGPVKVSAASGEDIRVTLSPLSNDQIHYLAVRAYDTGGQESSMSNVVTGTPKETFTAAALAGEAGGFCALPMTGSRGAAGLGLLAALSGLLALGRRRVAALALVGLPLAGLSTDARADDSADVQVFSDEVDEYTNIFQRPRSNGVVGLRVGPFTPDDKNLKTVFGDRAFGLVWIEGGPRLTRFFEIKGGIGFLQKKGYLVSASGAASADEDTLQAIPLSAGATARLDIVRNQLLVPYFGVGGDYWLWRERWDVDRAAGTTDSLGGAKAGWHWSAGGEILLDFFDRPGASRLEARKGIEDSYLVVEYRQQTIGEGGSGLVFSGSTVGIGLHLAY